MYVRHEYLSTYRISLGTLASLATLPDLAESATYKRARLKLVQTIKIQDVRARMLPF